MTKYGLTIIFLSMSLTLMPLGANFKALNQTKAEGWWETVNQGGLNKVGQAYGQTGTPSANYDIRIMVARLIRVVLELLGIIALVIIIAAGFRWMMANGNEEKVEEAKKQLINGVTGLIIILAAFAIATFVINQLEFITTGRQPITWF